MKVEETAARAAKDAKLRNEFISQYRNFILSEASKTVKRSVTESDDEYMVAMIAFNEAIDKYDESKGKFLSFAAMIIRSRIIDGIRRNNRNMSLPFSSMSKNDDRGESGEFEVPYEESHDLRWEIEALTTELKKFDISFRDLAKVTPKSKKTKKQCFTAAEYIKSVPMVLSAVVKEGVLPIKTICDNTVLNKKTLERHRKYIITAVIVMSHDYPMIKEYFDFKEKEV